MGRIVSVSTSAREAPLPVWTWPIPKHQDGRGPRISDGRKTKAQRDAKGSGRIHRGMDLMYRRKRASKRPYNHPWSSKWYEIPEDVPTPVLAAFTGRVIAAGIIDTGGLIMLDHGDGIGTAYHHLRGVYVGARYYMSEGPSLLGNAAWLPLETVRVGGIVQAGEVIGAVGGSPRGYGLCHVHFDLVHGLNARASTLKRGKLKGRFQDAAKQMRKWRILSYEDAWADFGRVGNDE